MVIAGNAPTVCADEPTAQSIRELGDRARVSGDPSAILSLKQILRGGIRALRRRAAYELGHARADAPEGVAQALRHAAIHDPESQVRSMALASLGLRWNWPPYGRDEATKRKVRIIQLLGDLRYGSLETVNRALCNAGELISSNPELQSAVTELLTSGNYSTQVLAAAAMAGVPLHVDRLALIPNKVRRGEILPAEVIENLVRQGLIAIPVLLDALQQERNLSLRANLKSALERILDAQGTETLHDLAKDDRPYIRRWALQKLIRLKEKSDVVAQALIRELGNSDYDVREAAVDELIEMGQVAVPALVTVIRDKDPLVRRKAAFLITVIGQLSDPAVDALVGGLGDEDEQVRFWACVSLGRVKNQQMRLAPLMVGRQTDASERVRFAARNAFQQLTVTEPTH